MFQPGTTGATCVGMDTLRVRPTYGITSLVLVVGAAFVGCAGVDEGRPISIPWPDEPILPLEIDGATVMDRGFSFVIQADEQYAVLAMGVPESWGRGEIEQIWIDHEEVTVLMRRANVEELPAALSARRGERMVARSPNGASCKARLGELGVMRRTWRNAFDMADWDESAIDEITPEGLWNIADTGAGMLVAVLEPESGPCADAAMAHSAAMPPFALYMRDEDALDVERDADARAALDGMHVHPLYARIQTDFESAMREDATLEPAEGAASNDSPGRWERHDGTLTASRWREAFGGPSLTSITAIAGHGCGDWSARLEMVYEGSPATSPPRIVERSYPDEAWMWLDIEGDGDLDRWTGETLILDAGTDHEHILNVAPTNGPCGC